MANAKKTNAKAKGVATKAKNTAKAKATPVVEATEEVVLDAKSDITEVVETVEAVVENPVAEGFHKCGTCQEVKEVNTENFSPINADANPNGEAGFHKTCKDCRTASSIAWTTKRKDYRKQYQRAVQLLNLGIPALVPNAKDWKEGDVIMTVVKNDEGEFVTGRPAEEVYTEMKQAEANKRAEAKSELDKQNAELKAARKQERLDAKAKRDAEAQDAKDARAAERAEAKKVRDAKRAEDAEAARLERIEKNAERAEARRVAAAEKAENARLAREKKQAERLEAANKRNLEKAAEAEQARLDRLAAATEKANAATA